MLDQNAKRSKFIKSDDWNTLARAHNNPSFNGNEQSVDPYRHNIEYNPGWIGPFECALDSSSNDYTITCGAKRSTSNYPNYFYKDIILFHNMAVTAWSQSSTGTLILTSAHSIDWKASVNQSGYLYLNVNMADWKYNMTNFTTADISLSGESSPPGAVTAYKIPLAYIDYYNTPGSEKILSITQLHYGVINIYPVRPETLFGSGNSFDSSKQQYLGHNGGNGFEWFNSIDYDNSEVSHGAAGGPVHENQSNSV